MYKFALFSEWVQVLSVGSWFQGVMFTFQEGFKQGAVKEINFSLMANVSFVPEGLCFHIYMYNLPVAKTSQNFLAVLLFS